MKIYGWEELNECSYGTILVREMDKPFIEMLDEETQEVSILNSLDNGHWFLTFSAAKKAMIEALEYQMSWIKDAIKQAKALRKNNL